MPEQVYPRPVTQNLRFDGPVLLRDGRSAILRAATRDDLPELVKLLERSSNHSIKLRFFGPMRRDRRTAEFLIRDHLEGVDSGRFAGLSLVLLEGAGEAQRILAVASCVPLDREKAEVAFLVEDDAHGRGIGTLLIERLAYAAELGGMSKLVATTVLENDAMIRVFRDCGYNAVSSLRTGEVHIEFDIVPSAQSVRAIEARDRAASRASIAPFFRPGSIALVGEQGRGGAIEALLGNLDRAGYGGGLQVVSADAIADRACAASFDQLAAPVELLVLLVAPDQAGSYLRGAIAKDVRAVLLLADGRHEAVDAWRSQEATLRELARAGGMRLIGPNSHGLVSTDAAQPLHLGFASAMVPAGHLAMSCQSGALSTALQDGARRCGLGFSSFVNVGYKADVSANDLLQYWEEDPRTRVILLYLESLGNPRRFARIARRVTRRKPVLVVTGRRSRSPMLQEATFFRQAGVLRAASLEEMFDVARLLSHQVLPGGRKVAVLSNSRGLAGLCAGTLQAHGVDLPAVSPGLAGRLRGLLPEINLTNPIDLTAFVEPAVYGQVLAAVLGDPGVDVVLAIHVTPDPQARAAVLRAIAETRLASASALRVPLVCCFMDPPSGSLELGTGDEIIPCYPYPESAALAVSRACEYADWLRRPSGVIPKLEGMDLEAAWAMCRKALGEGRSALYFDESRELLGAMGLKLQPVEGCADLAEAQARLRRARVPSRLCLPSTGAVSAWIAPGADPGPEWHRLAPGAAGHPLWSPQPAPGLGLEIGLQEDPDHGPLARFGLAGVATDLFQDRSCRITPLTDQDAIEMLHEVRAAPLLEGYETGLAVDKEAIIDLLLRLSWLHEELPPVASLELLGCWATAAGVSVLGARVGLRPG